MYSGLKHLHILLILPFVISVLIKAILLITNSDQFDGYRKNTKVPEMVITMLFLVTGIIMISMRGGGLHYFFYIKLTVIAAATILAIIGFKKKNKILGLISTVLFILTIGLALKSGNNMKEVHVDIPATDPNYGKALYDANCATCHGVGGAKQLGKAADLTATEMTALQIGYIITDGLESMNAFKTLDSVEVKAIGDYALTLKPK